MWHDSLGMKATQFPNCCFTVTATNPVAKPKSRGARERYTSRVKTQGRVGVVEGCRNAIDGVECPLQEGVITALGQGDETIQGCLQAKPRLQTTGHMPAYALPTNTVNQTATTPCALLRPIAVRCPSKLC